MKHAELCKLALVWMKRPYSRSGHGCKVAIDERRTGWNGETPDARFLGLHDGVSVIECLGDFRSTHDVPADVVERMRAEWEPYAGALQVVEGQQLELWTTYDSPMDLPGRFVARKRVLDKPKSELLQDKTLKRLRAKLPPGLYCMPRSPGDDPQIVETWM